MQAAHTAQAGSAQVDTVAQVAIDHGATFTFDGGALHVGPATAPAQGKAPACFHCGTRCPHAVVRVVESPTMVGNLCTACVGDWYIPHVSAQGAGTWCYRVPGAERMTAGAPILPDADNACATCGDVMPGIGGHTVVDGDGYTRHHADCMPAEQVATSVLYFDTDTAPSVQDMADAIDGATVGRTPYGIPCVQRGAAHATYTSGDGFGRLQAGVHVGGTAGDVAELVRELVAIGARYVSGQAPAEQVAPDADAIAAGQVLALHADAVQALQAAGAAATVAIVGTRVPHVAVLCGDGAPAVVDALAAAGIDTTAGTLSVHRYCVGCSAHLTGDAEQGTDAPRLYRGARVRMAIDTNGQRDTVARIVRAHGGTVTDATGVFGGDTLPSVLADIDADMVTSVHIALRAMVDGYGCAAVMSARGAA